MRGNVSNIDTTHVRWAAGTGEVWIEDSVRFRAGAPGTRDVLLAAGGAVTAHLNCTTQNHQNITREDGGTVAFANRAAMTAQRTRVEFFPAHMFGLSGAAASTLGSAQVRISTVNFAEGDDDYANLTWRVPANYNGENVTMHIWWTVGVTPGGDNVIWRAYVRGIVDGGLVNASGQSLVLTAAEPSAANEIKRSAFSAITAASASLAADGLVRIEIRRNSGEGTDTSSVNAHLVGIELSYTENLRIGI